MGLFVLLMTLAALAEAHGHHDGAHRWGGEKIHVHDAHEHATGGTFFFSTRWIAEVEQGGLRRCSGWWSGF
jgi:hypothetical protein